MLLFGLQQTENKNSLAMAIESLSANTSNKMQINSNLTRTVMSNKPRDANADHELKSAISSMQIAVESIAHELGMDTLNPAQMTAGVAAGLMCGDVKYSMGYSAPAGISTESNVYISATPFASDVMRRSSVAMEAYNNANHRDTSATTILYNVQAAQQETFAETLFPTVTLSPELSGLTIRARINNVLNDIKRNVNGVVTPFARQSQNLLRAESDHTILHNDTTRCTPVVRANSAQFFIDPALVSPAPVLVEGETITTAPLAVGKRFGLLELSQTDTLLAAGVPDITDSLEPGVGLTNIYVSVPVAAQPAIAASGVGVLPVVLAQAAIPAGFEVIRFNVRDLPYTNFVPSLQDNEQKAILNFDTKSVLISGGTRLNNGALSVSLAPFIAGNYQIRLNIAMTGDINLEFSDTAVYFNALSVGAVYTAAGTAVPLDSGVGLEVVNALAAAKVEGYDLIAYRSNQNRRERGQIVNTQYISQQYRVGFRAPLTSIRPVNAEDDADALQGLLAATQTRSNNEAVTVLQQAASLLADHAGHAIAGAPVPDVLGVGRHLVIPTYHSYDFVAVNEVASLNSHTVTDDLVSALVNRLRDMSFTLLRDSQYMTASVARNNGAKIYPTIIMATDIMTARYLNVKGELNKLTDELSVRVVVSPDTRMYGKLYMVMGDFTSGATGEPNPLHFGTRAWKPEIVTALNISRNGSTSNELTVQPAFLHIPNCPVMGFMTVSGLPEVFLKTAINFHTV